MSTVAILGAGPIGASIAHRLSQRQRVRGVLLIDANGSAASGKALDIRQSGPVEHFDTIVQASDNVLDAIGAAVIVLADEMSGTEWEGERGLALVMQLARAGAKAPIVFAGPQQVWLMEKSFSEVRVAPDRLIGSAPSAVASAARAWTGLELGLASVDVAVVGRPPQFVVGWSAASVGGALVSERVAPHRLLAVSQSMTRLWPPGPLAIASATAPIVEALVSGSRTLHPAMTLLDGVLGARARAVMLPLALGHGRVISHQMPSLSPQERTELMNAIINS